MEAVYFNMISARDLYSERGAKRSLDSQAMNGPIVSALMIDDRHGVFDGMMIGRLKQKYAEKTCPSVTLSTINPT
jgi:hypothetical protein